MDGITQSQFDAKVREVAEDLGKGESEARSIVRWAYGDPVPSLPIPTTDKHIAPYCPVCGVFHADGACDTPPDERDPERWDGLY